MNRPQKRAGWLSAECHHHLPNEALLAVLIMLRGAKTRLVHLNTCKKFIDCNETTFSLISSMDGENFGSKQIFEKASYGERMTRSSGLGFCLKQEVINVTKCGMAGASQLVRIEWIQRRVLVVKAFDQKLSTRAGQYDKQPCSGPVAAPLKIGSECQVIALTPAQFWETRCL